MFLNSYFRKSSLEKVTVDIKSPSPVLTHAQWVNENMISIKFNVNIKGGEMIQKWCNSNSDPTVCCRHLVLRDTPQARGKEIIV